MTIAEIVLASGDNKRFAAWLRFELPWEVKLAEDGKTILVENVKGDGGGLTFAGVDKSSHPNFPYSSPTLAAVILSYQTDWDSVEANSLQIPVGETVANFAVNMGARRAAKLLQRCLPGVAVDGDIGPKTINAVDAAPDKLKLALLVVAYADAYYNALADRSARYHQFLRGWLNRDRDLIVFDHSDPISISTVA